MRPRCSTAAGAPATCGLSCCRFPGPALGTLAVYAFLNTYNQYYWPLLVTDSPEWRTTQVGITAFQSSEVALLTCRWRARSSSWCPP